MPASPTLRDAEACVQSQAGLVPVTPPEELALVHYRKGYCTLASAALTQNNAGYRAAADEFQKAIASWPLRLAKAGKKIPPEPVSSGLEVLAAISRIHTGSGELAPVEIAEIASAVQTARCSSNVMQTDVCRQVLETGRLWLGWMSLRANNLEEAGTCFAGSPATGWPAWVAGRKAFDSRNYRAAAADYTEAITIWKSRWQATGGTAFLPGLGPRPDLASALTDLGGAELLTGDTKSAIATLFAAIKTEAAVKTGPAQARPLFLRGRAYELAGQMDDALADYNLASRTAFANAKDQASGEAHLYRGIVLYRRRDFPRAENEFASALNFEIPSDLRPDAVAWRQLAAVAGGACATARQYLERSLAAVSPYFPIEEARSLAAGCATVQDRMASRSVNKVILIGHLGKDAETKFTPSGISVSKFTLATNRRTKDQQSGEWKDITDWHNIVMWRTEHVANFLLKGKQIFLEGRLETRSYEDKERQKKYFTEVVCEAQSLVLLGGGAGRGDGPPEGSGDYERPVSMPRSARPPSEAPAAPAEEFNQGITDDDVPF
ncbi:MAG TPA: single-stranded DNA-binding protein [Candidatus Acidoferrales bacterium]|nr:single-stranded DNA-binding protein [Candidatus Acidoferrales bacterium]